MSTRTETVAKISSASQAQLEQDNEDAGPSAYAVPDIDLRSGILQGPPSDVTSEPRNEDEKKQDAELATRLAALIEDANQRVIPLTNMIRKVRLQRASLEYLQDIDEAPLRIAHRGHGSPTRRRS